MPLPVPDAALLRIIDNLIAASASSGRTMATDFLDAAASASLLPYTQKRFDGETILAGGYDGAERRLLILAPPGQDPDISRFIALAEIIPADKKIKLGHRDYLGSIMAAGLSRSKLGDILVSQNRAQVFASPQTIKILCSQLDRVAGTSVGVAQIPLESAAAPSEQAAAELTVSVSSLRLDCVVSAAFKMARSRAAAAITAGQVTVNWREITKPDYHLAEGDMIGFRGRGRSRLSSVGGLSRKGHTFLTLEVM